MATVKTTKMDAQGRVIIPPHIRNELNLYAGQSLKVSFENGIIKLWTEEERCIICGDSVKGKRHAEITGGPATKCVCTSCALVLADMVLKGRGTKEGQP